jgi:hypothetical protein
MRNIALAGLVALAVSAAACSDNKRPEVTAPELQPRFVTAPEPTPCQASIATNVERDQIRTFNGSALTTIQQKWQLVKDNCDPADAAKLAAAREYFMEYVRFTIVTWDSNLSGINGPGDRNAKASSITSHWNLAFNYVGYASPALASQSLVDGAAKVITVADLAASPNYVEFGIPQKAEMKVPQQTGASNRGHLFVIYPTICPVNNIFGQSADCYEFASFPRETPFNPPLTIGICTPENLGFDVPKLGHYENGELVILQTLQYPSPTFCDTPTTSVPRYGATRFLYKFNQLASSFFGVKRAYASHGGLGDDNIGFLSPFVPVETRMFKATFTGNAVGTSPTVGALPDPDKGYWTKVLAQPPGSILVQNSLADISSKPVVLNQAGGNCNANCGGLDLWGQLKTADGTTNMVSSGKYSIAWTSVQTQPSPKNAPIVIRTSGGSEIARLAYSRETSFNRLRYNGAIVGAWTRNVAQNFRIELDFGQARTSKLYINNTLVATVPLGSGATDLSKIQAEFSGIDSGIVGWDNITIDRLPDN